MNKVVYVDPGDAAEWEEQALCRNIEDQGLFFPEHNNRSPARAKRMCGRCPVRDQCLEAALTNDERFGIWGGMTERERSELRGKVDVG
jgi:WhiB family redox-sensing transcriptional regulator